VRVCACARVLVSVLVSVRACASWRACVRACELCFDLIC